MVIFPENKMGAKPTDLSSLSPEHPCNERLCKAAKAIEGSRESSFVTLSALPASALFRTHPSLTSLAVIRRYFKSGESKGLSDRHVSEDRGRKRSPKCHIEHTFKDSAFKLCQQMILERSDCVYVCPQEH